MRNTTSHQLFRITACLLCLGLAGAAGAQAPVQNPAVKKHDVSQLAADVEAFLLHETSGYPGVVNVNVLALDRNLKLAPCIAPVFTLPNGSRAWGKTSVAVQCSAPVKWTVYVQANVSVMADYLVAGVPLAQGHVMTQEDVLSVKGDLTKLPAGIFTDAKQVVGRTASVSLMSGAVLRQEMLRQPLAVQQGQSVTLRATGKGFQVSTEAKALANAADGQKVQVKVASGQVISGIARNGGQVDAVF